ncbi:MAG: type II secretion system F family protein [Clostridia bacterium]|nr:type II secretion system F family protein [Clostridia bacterium]
MAGKRNRGITSAELSSFCSQIALILSAGLPLYDGMETLAETTKGSEYADLYALASQRVNETGSLHEALKQDSRWPTYLVEMAGIGEQTGQLESVMNGLADYYGREDRIRTSVVSAITYPLVLGVMLVLIIMIMLWKVLPVFQRVLNSMGMELTRSGSALMKLGSTIGWVVLALVGLVVLAVLVCAILMKTSARESVLGFLRRLFPPIRTLSMKLSASRVASVLSMMLSSGFPTGEAFRLLPSIISDGEAARKVEGIRSELDSGASFADAVSHSKLFDGLHDRMIRMGVAAGREDQVMARISGIYEEQVETGIAQLVAIIEPTLIALLSIVIGAILLSVMLPMAGILSSML